MRRLAAAAALLSTSVATPALADDIAITKSAVVLSDPMANIAPRSFPGAIVEYRTLATNPLANVLLTIRTIQLVDYLPDTVIMRVADIAAAGKGPVAFADGSLLGTGLLPSGMSYTYSTVSPTTDGLEFWDGSSWAYQPVADAQGYDANVRGVRVSLTGTFATTRSFQLRYRIRIR